MIYLAAVIPCAQRHRVTLRRHGSFQPETFVMIPCLRRTALVLHRARDDAAAGNISDV